MKTKDAAIVLLIGSIIWLVVEGFWAIERFTDSWNYFKNEPAKLIFATAMLIVPLCLLIFSITLLNDRHPKDSIRSVENAITEVEKIPTVGDWLINFLIVAIPLVGLIFLIIWANDDKNRIRKNWAIGMLIWSLVISIISVLFFFAIISTFKDRDRSFFQ